MNIQPGKTKKNMSVIRSARSTGNGVGTKIATVFRVAFFVAVIAGIVNSYIYLNQKIVETDRMIASGKREIHKVEREIELLRVHREEFRSWKHIRPMMERFGLRMVYPQSGQVCSLTVLSAEQAALVPFDHQPESRVAAANPAAVSAETASRQTVKKAEDPAQKKITVSRKSVKKTAVVETKKVRKAVKVPAARRNAGRTRNGYPLFDAADY